MNLSNLQCVTARSGTSGQQLTRRLAVDALGGLEARTKVVLDGDLASAQKPLAARDLRNARPLGPVECEY